MASKDLTNKVFGKLTAKYIAPNIIVDNKPQVAWYCECECGNTCIVGANSLLSGQVVSCGCDKDLAGQRYGRFIVQPYYEIREVSKSNSNKERFWLCKCDCGEIKFVSANDLINGVSVSCGCYKEKVSRKPHKSNKSTNENKSAIPNKYDLETEDYGIGYCVNDSQTFYFDKEDFDKIKQYKWYHKPGKYDEIMATINGKTVYMHSLIITTPKDKYVTHINERCDNRKSNLRIIDIYTMRQLSSLRKNNKSGTTGVSFSKSRNMWKASITCREVSKVCYFDTKAKAIAQRKTWEKEMFD